MYNKFLNYLIMLRNWEWMGVELLMEEWMDVEVWMEEWMGDRLKMLVVALIFYCWELR